MIILKENHVKLLCVMKLESYIKENRKALDVEKPDEKYLWKGIIKAVGSLKKPRRLIISRSVAAVAAITILAIIGAYFIGRNQHNNLILVNVDSKLAKQEVILLRQIDDYSEQIKKTGFNVDQLVSGNREVEYIDDLIHYYSEDLKQNGPNPRLINSLIDLYEKKILVLNRMLNEIEKYESHEKRKINL